MTLALAYWVLMLLWLILSIAAFIPLGAAGNMRLGSSSLLLFILLVLVGWKVFGPPIQG